MDTIPRKPFFSSDYQRDVLICLGLALAVFIPYKQVAGHRFVEFDDSLYVFHNLHIIKGLSWESLVWAFTNTDAANWHPLTWLTLLIDRELFGPYPGGYLLMNVAWHTAAVCTCYIAFLHVTRRRFFAAAVTLFFALHPANVENVAWLSERKSLLDALFWFLGIIAYVGFIETRRWTFFGLVLITHILGLLAKAMHVTFPCTLVLVHVLHTICQRESASTTMREYGHLVVHALKLTWPLLALSLYFAVVTTSAQAPAMNSLTTLTPGMRFINVTWSYERYLSMFFLPNEFAYFYPLFFSELTWDRAILPCLLLIAITLATVLLTRKLPELLLGWLWFLGTMVPVIGIVHVGSQSHADRYLYIPMIGLSFLFPTLFRVLKQRAETLAERLAAGWLSVTAASLIAITNIQVSYWKDGITLFRHGLSVTGDCMMTVTNLAGACMRNERNADAVSLLTEKIGISQNPYNKVKLIALRGTAYLMLEKYQEAAADASQAIEMGNNELATYICAAYAYKALGKRDTAREFIKKSKRARQPSNASIFLNDANLESAFKQLTLELVDGSG